jgi:signal transduction histidine kinase
MDLAWVARRVGGNPPVLDKLAEMARSTDDIIGVVRRISAELRPGILDDLGLVAAIEWQLEDFERRTQITCELRSTFGDLQLDRELATAVFRIFQEALTNVARHARAAEVTVDLALVRGSLVLDIADDGVGIGEVRSGALGLLGMRERARRLGGSCEVRRGTLGGTIVSVKVPLRFRPERRTDADTTIGA